MTKDGSHNWWGIAWIEKMQRLAEPGRFAEGVRYARNGFVQSVVFDQGTIAARVSVPKEPSCIVGISITPFTDEQWTSLLAEVRDPDRLVRQLVSGDLPFEINTAFSRAGLRFMPERYVDLQLQCACPDWLKPCRHLVAVWLKFARDFNRDPFLVFALRGLTRDALIARLQGRNFNAVAEREQEEELPEAAIVVTPQALPADPAAFWSAPPLPFAPSDSAERSVLDEDIFETLRDWPKLEPQFSQIYDAVYELATRIRR